MALHAVNAAGSRSLAQMAELGDLPLLQDDDDARVEERWGAEYRDVIILNAENVPVAVFNLSANDLRDASNFEALRRVLLSVD